MASNDDILNLFTTRVRQLMLQYKELEEENASLCEQLRRKNEEIDLLTSEIERVSQDYNSLKTAKMLEVTSQDIDNAKKRVAKLIREVNKCITLLRAE